MIADCAGVVLAGGRGRRLGGGDDARLPRAGRPMVERVLDVLRPIFGGEIVLVGASEEPYAGLGVRVVLDRHPGAGPLAGLEAGLAATARRRAFVVACDMPSLSGELVRFLAALDPGARAVVPVAGERLQPLHAVYARDLAALATTALESGVRRMEDFLERVVPWRRVEESEFAAIPGALRSFANVNTPEDRAAAERPILGVSAPANGSGKTMVVCRLLEAFPRRFAAVKAITIYSEGRFCPSDGMDCACRHIEADFQVIVDPRTIAQSETDTGRMTVAGARSVVWGLAVPGAHERMWAALVPHLPPGVPVLCEGSRIQSVARPVGRIFVLDPSVHRGRWKDDAEANLRSADWVVVNRWRGGQEVDANLAWVAERRAGERVLVADASAPLRSWAPREFLDWVASFA